MTLSEKLRADYDLIFGRQWPVWVGGLLIGVLNVFLFMFYQPWTTLDGVLNWGQWTLGGLGVITAEALSPLLRSGSVINFGLLFGALLAALLAGQFGIRIGPNRELVKGALGGALIGLGAVLVRGCNIGGFFSGTGSLGMQGVMMGVGLVIGAFFGARYIAWELDHIAAKPADANSFRRKSHLSNARLQPYVGVAVSLLLVGGAIAYIRAGFPDRALILAFGAILGVISQRSRFCFVRAFREPFLTGESSHTKAMLLALLISIVGITIFKFIVLERVDEFVRSTFWLGSLIGGVIFGVGMVISGGCGGGAIWRASEGHVKLWVVLFGYIVSATLFNEWLINSGLIQRLGQAVFLPDVIGWGWAVFSLLALLAVWYVAVQWNELTHKFAAL